MKISTRIKQVMKERGMTQSELSKESGISKSTLSEWLNDKYEPKQNSIYILSQTLGVSPTWLMGLDVDKENELDISEIYNQLNKPRKNKVYNYAEHELKEQNKVINLKETQVVYLNSKLSAGTGILDLDPADTKEIEYNGYVPKHDLAFLVDGNSMEPTFQNGEVVFVERTPDIHSGQFIAVQVNEEAFIKKAYIEDERLRLVSLNKDYEDIYADGHDDIRVIGRVIL